MLKEKGLLQYDDDCKKQVPELPYDCIRNLKTHTSGITKYFNLLQRYTTPLDTHTNEKMIRLYEPINHRWILLPVPNGVTTAPIMYCW